MTYKTLPTEIIEVIFQELSVKDLFTCQSVCKNFHTLAKREAYKQVEFKSSFSINWFLSCISRKSNCNLLGIPPPGPFVERLFFNHSPTTSVLQNFSIGSALSPKHLTALAKECPNVLMVDCTQNLSSVVVTALLSLNDEIAWKKLTSFPDSMISPELYQQCSYKYRMSLTTLYLGSKCQGNFSILCNFPCLKILDISSASLNCIDELEYILKTCPRLGQLAIAVKQSARQMYTSTISTYPSLKLLKLTTEDDGYNHSFFSYIMTKFNGLLSFEVYGVDILDNALRNKAECLTLFRWINTLRSSEMVLTGHDYNATPHVAREYLSSIFKTQLQEVKYITTLNIYNTNHEMVNSNNTTSLVFSTMLINPLCIQRDIDIRLPEFETNNRQLHSNYIDQFCAHVHELFISYEGTPVYADGCAQFLDSIIDKCMVLRTLSVNYCDLGLRTSAINETITECCISNSQISPAFFETLSFCCPQLAHLTLHRNFHSRNDNYAIFLCLPHSNLESISLLGEVHFPWLPTSVNHNNALDWTIEVNTSINNKSRYFKTSVTDSTIKEFYKNNSMENYMTLGIYCKSIKTLKASIPFIEFTLELQ